MKQTITLFSVLVILLTSCSNPELFHYNKGNVFGTSYNIKYKAPKDMHEGLQKILAKIDSSLSTYSGTSIISKLNLNQEVALDEHFIKVFNKAQKVSEETDGAYDITAGALVNTWGFGYKEAKFPEANLIDSLMTFTGYKKVHLENGAIVKDMPEVNLDASSIAKGYGVDVVADYFESNGIENYMIEIGGEIRAKGKNPKMRPWRIGIDIPKDSPVKMGTSLQEVISVEDGAVATSGNYRRYYYKDGKKYAHIINPKTGYPVDHNILSTTVYTDDCMSADAYATAFMVMDLEKTKAFTKKHPELKVYVIYAKDSLNNDIWMTPNFKDIILKR